MKQNKLVYQAPEAEIFEVRLNGGMLMSSPNPVYGGQGQAGSETEDEDYGGF